MPQHCSRATGNVLKLDHCQEHQPDGLDITIGIGSLRSWLGNNGLNANVSFLITGMLSISLCRDDMQDFLDVVPKARCGFLCAGHHHCAVIICKQYKGINVLLYGAKGQSLGYSA